MSGLRESLLAETEHEAAESGNRQLSSVTGSRATLNAPTFALLQAAPFRGTEPEELPTRELLSRL